ncbi:MAG: fumarylacetoacetase [Candidatus Eiseniibacteriota bacterium]
MTTDSTTDPALRSFVDVAADSHFPIQNLPYGVFRPRAGGTARVGVRIGDRVLDLALLEERGLLDVPPLARGTFATPRLNAFLALGRPAWRATRTLLSDLLRDDTPTLRDDAALRDAALYRIEDVQLELPVDIGDYTDFYSSKEHATNVGTMFRGKENALMPNWCELPVAYHGRASSVVIDGTPVRRPRGQTIADGAARPTFGPSRLLDFELEMGFFVGPGNPLGQPIPVGEAVDHILGMVLVNDWSARDIQKWEYQPLGPFNAKNFATSISPWVVTLDALEPFRCAGPSQEPTPLEYLAATRDQAYDIRLEVALAVPGVAAPARICTSNFRHLYWSIAQQLAHHTITGCNLRPGDLLASGTISAPDPGGYGSLLELTWRGSKPLELAAGVSRTFLADGDTVTMNGFCQGDGYRVGFGEVSGTILPALG